MAYLDLTSCVHCFLHLICNLKSELHRKGASHRITPSSVNLPIVAFVLCFSGSLRFIIDYTDTNISSHRIADPTQRENLGIIVQYKVKVKLCIGGPILGG